MYHLDQSKFAYIIGGIQTKDNFELHCKKLEINNLKTAKFASLIIGREYPGVMATNQDLYVFGGRGKTMCVDRIEKSDLNSNAEYFEEVYI